MRHKDGTDKNGIHGRVRLVVLTPLALAGLSKF